MASSRRLADELRERLHEQGREPGEPRARLVFSRPLRAVLQGSIDTLCARASRISSASGTARASA